MEEKESDDRETSGRVISNCVPLDPFETNFEYTCIGSHDEVDYEVACKWTEWVEKAA